MVFWALCVKLKWLQQLLELYCNRWSGIKHPSADHSVKDEFTLQSLVDTGCMKTMPRVTDVFTFMRMRGCSMHPCVCFPFGWTRRLFLICHWCRSTALNSLWVRLGKCTCTDVTLGAAAVSQLTAMGQPTQGCTNHLQIPMQLNTAVTHSV